MLDVHTPIYTTFNDVEELGDIAIADLNPYTDQNYIKVDYNIIYKTRQYKIALLEWNRKDTHDKTWAAFKANF